MLVEEATKGLDAAALTHLAEHPSDRLVHQVVRVMEVAQGVAQAPVGVASLRSLPSADDAHTLPPEVGAISEVVDDRLLVGLVAESGGEEDPASDNLYDREVDEVPVVGILSLLDVERDNLIAFPNSGRSIDKTFLALSEEHVDEDEEAAETNLVPGAMNESGHLVAGDTRGVANYLVNLRVLDAEELIAVAILPFGSLEEAHELTTLSLIAQREHVVNNLISVHRHKTRGNRTEER